MSDTYNISNIEDFRAEIPSMEISDISKIIKTMINMKNDLNRIKTKKTKPYDIDEKSILNQFTYNLQAKIKKYHIESYDLVDEAMSCIEEMEASIRSDLYDYYWEIYTEVLTDMGININDYENIQKNSDKIYLDLLNKIDKQIFVGRISSIETNKKVTYLNAITAHVFYNCKFLISVENNDGCL